MAYYQLVLSLISIARGSRTMKTVQLAENEVRALCLKSRDIFLEQPILLELVAPLKVCGELTIGMLAKLRGEVNGCGWSKVCLLKIASLVS